MEREDGIEGVSERPEPCATTTAAPAMVADVDVDLEKNLPTEKTTSRSSVESESRDEGTPEDTTAAPPQDDGPYSIWTHRQKVIMVLLVSFMALISPLSGQIYLPALPTLARDLHVSDSLINLTITTYVIFQGIAPSFIGNFSDSYGRRPAYVICCFIYLAANIGLALQRSFPALMVLRCFQSCGSSATVALSSATVADLVTRAERGKYIGYAAMGTTLGPALGPVIGGLLAEYLGWESIFWFLAIFSGGMFCLVFCFLPETCRAVVGNGSVPVPWWNRSLWFLLTEWHKKRKRGAEPEVDRSTVGLPRKRPNPFAALKILAEKEGGVTLGFGALLFGGYYCILTTLPAQLSERFGFSSVFIGLCFLPLGVGTLVSRYTCGYVIDWNFRRHSRRLGLEVSLARQQNLEALPIERIRLQVAIPLVYCSSAAILGYGWAMEARAPLPVIEICLFIGGLFFSGTLSSLNTLIVDTHADRPATAVAANNLFRCLVGAGASAMALPFIAVAGMGWVVTFVAGIWILFSPCLWLVFFRGARWRAELAEKKARRKEKEGQKTKKKEATR